MIFVDTSAWFALFVPQDKNHADAIRLRERARGRPFVTSAFVLDELFTLLRVRNAGDRIEPLPAIARYRVGQITTSSAPSLFDGEEG